MLRQSQKIRAQKIAVAFSEYEIQEMELNKDGLFELTLKDNNDGFTDLGSPEDYVRYFGEDDPNRIKNTTIEQNGNISLFGSSMRLEQIKSFDDLSIRELTDAVKNNFSVVESALESLSPDCMNEIADIREYTNEFIVANEIKNRIEDSILKKNIDAFKIDNWICDSKKGFNILYVQYLSDGDLYSTELDVNNMGRAKEHISSGFVDRWLGVDLQKEILRGSSKENLNAIANAVDVVKDDLDVIVRAIVNNSFSEIVDNKELGYLSDKVFDVLVEQMKMNLWDNTTNTLSTNFYDSHLTGREKEGTPLGLMALTSGYKRSEKPLHVGFVDFNNFKYINDKYGHDKGDEVLKAYVEELKLINGSNSVIRRGGDEFVILSTKDKAFKTVSELSSVEIIKKISSNVGLDKGDLISLSIGFSKGVDSSYLDSQTFKALVNEADDISRLIKPLAHKKFGSQRVEQRSDERIKEDTNQYRSVMSSNIDLLLDSELFGEKDNNLYKIDMSVTPIMIINDSSDPFVITEILDAPPAKEDAVKKEEVSKQLPVGSPQ